jgi:outer membrane protein assembly factor BamB
MMRVTSVRIAAVVGLSLLATGPARGQTPSPARDGDSGGAQFRGDAARTGAYGDPGPAAGPEVAWRLDTEGTIRSTPAATDAAIYVGDGAGRVMAVDPVTGDILWQYDAGDPVIGSPAVSGEVVVVSTRSGAVHAVDTGTGRPAWSVPGPGAAPLRGGWDYFGSSPAVAGERVVLGAPDGSVRAFDRASGQPLWRYDAGAPVRSSAAIAGGAVVVGDDAGRIHAVSLEDGSPLWRHETVGAGLGFEEFGFDRTTIQASPAIADGRVYVGSRDGGFYALDMESGERLWRVDYGFPWVVASAAVRDGRVYLGSSDGHFVQALDAGTGDEIWRTDLGTRVFASPAATPGALYVADHGGFVRALDPATGQVLWSLRLAQQIQSSPVPYGHALLIGTDGGALYRIDAGAATPHQAVFWDSAMATLAIRPGGRRLRDYLADGGYEVLDAAALPGWLAARETAGGPSVVVFALDHAPESVAPSDTDSVGRLRRYLEAGGKVVWTGFPPWSLERDSAGQAVRIDHGRHRRILDLDLSRGETGEYGARPTDEGRRWGLTGPVLSTTALAPAPSVTALARDELGRIAAGVRSYGGPEGTGFVILFGQGAPWDRLPAIRAAAEYGIVRAPAAPRTATPDR